MKKSELKKILPPLVWQQVDRWMKENRKRASSVVLSDMTGHTLYFAEDRRYSAYRAGEDLGTISCGGEWGGYKKNDPIGKETIPPTGTWVVETGYYYGPRICVMNWGDGSNRLNA